MNWFYQRIKNFGYAFKGLRISWEEPHVKIHVVAIVLVLIGGNWLGLTYLEWVAVLVCFALVLSAELFNTAIEKLADRVCVEQDPLIGQAKDLAAAAVLFASMISVVIGIIIVIHHV
jgi:diacylglycerol kinase (ATP)